ncbi:hypothetical protein SAMN05421831_1053 [Allopseudospirillum japonicum]|uniref:Uncharacterized protein n=1 Tax=Allopseudospirillum japonicum TaxID=64971 RepID=A0A1H6S657_9GAMM|nr:hypothetical protein [Allopseudospirillum japonicum]SEI59205.1 hypothetical protein SAMN05421831_1053 [Allopseudospirillum japonicum]
MKTKNVGLALYYIFLAICLVSMAGVQILFFDYTWSVTVMVIAIEFILVSLLAYLPELWRFHWKKAPLVSIAKL